LIDALLHSHRSDQHRSPARYAGSLLAGSAVFLAILSSSRGLCTRLEGVRFRLSNHSSRCHLELCPCALFSCKAALNIFGVSVAPLRSRGMAVIAVIDWMMLNIAPRPHDRENVAQGVPSQGFQRHDFGGWRRKAEPSPASVGVMPLGFPSYAGLGILSPTLPEAAGVGRSIWPRSLRSAQTGRSCPSCSARHANPSIDRR